MDLVLLYSSQLKQLSVMSDRLKQRLLAQYPDMKFTIIGETCCLCLMEIWVVMVCE